MIRGGGRGGQCAGLLFRRGKAFSEAANINPEHPPS